MIGSTDSVRVVLTTMEDTAAAERLARVLVDERLIACANLVPGIMSIYRWQSQVQTSQEVLLVLKTSEGVLEQAMQRVADLHPYAVPEIVCLPPSAASPAYAAWVSHETGPQPT